MSYEDKFLIALFLTLASEVPVVILILRYVYKNNQLKTSLILFVSILASILTLPYLWFVLPSFGFSRMVFVLLGESIVILVEMLIYFELLNLKLSKAFVLSLVANIASIIVGLIIKI